MIDFDITIKAIEYGIHLCMHGWRKQCRVIKGKANIIGSLRNIYTSQSSQLRGTGKSEEIKNGIAAKGLGRNIYRQ